MTVRRLAALLVAAVVLPSCARQRPNPKLVLQPITAERRWVSEKERAHPLVGRIWDRRARAFVTEETLTAALVSSDFVLLGETHDNPDHHLLQARLVRSIARAGKRPALAFEMMGEDQQAAVDAALARSPGDPDAVARAVDWEHSGWYGFSMYRPIFAAGLAGGMPIVAASLPVSVAKAVAKAGPEALPSGLRATLATYEPLPADVVASLRAEMKASHCDAPLPEPFLDKLAVAQRARDAHMASRMLAGGGAAGAILVTGFGHARTDRGVPSYLAREAAGRKTVAVAFFEVVPGTTEPEGYAEHVGVVGALPFDYVVFTPVTQREDPCAGLRGHDWSHGMTGAPKTATEPGAAPRPDGAGAPATDR